MYRESLARLAPGYDPRHIEAFMRSACGTLDHLSSSTFAAEVRTACACIAEGGR